MVFLPLKWLGVVCWMLIDDGYLSFAYLIRWRFIGGVCCVCIRVNVFDHSHLFGGMFCRCRLDYFAPMYTSYVSMYMYFCILFWRWGKRLYWIGISLRFSYISQAFRSEGERIRGIPTPKDLSDVIRICDLTITRWELGIPPLDQAALVSIYMYVCHRIHLVNVCTHRRHS